MKTGIKPTEADTYPSQDNFERIQRCLRLENMNQVYFAYNLIILSRENHNEPIDKLRIDEYESLCKTKQRMIIHSDIYECLYVFINLRYLISTDQYAYAITHRFMKMYPEIVHKRQLPTEIPLEQIEDKYFTFT